MVRQKNIFIWWYMITKRLGTPAIEEPPVRETRILWERKTVKQNLGITIIFISITLSSKFLLKMTLYLRVCQKLPVYVIVWFPPLVDKNESGEFPSDEKTGRGCGIRFFEALHQRTFQAFVDASMQLFAHWKCFGFKISGRSWNVYWRLKFKVELLSVYSSQWPIKW